jgi:TetR/AcrR family transcriptional regulator, macrolide resistance operon repressor
MARPQTVTDAEILHAARQVIGRRGYDRFSLSEVAADLGISRGAIISRFESTRMLKLRLSAWQIANLAAFLRALPVLQNGDGLIHYAAAIGSLINRDNLRSFSVVVEGNLKDPDLARLELQRRPLVRAAIAARMPKSAIDRESAVTLFEAHIGGSIAQWETLSGITAADYLIAQTRAWLTLAGIDFSRSYRPLLAPATGLSPWDATRPKPAAARRTARLRSRSKTDATGNGVHR